MIASIEGILEESNLFQSTIIVNGIGYEVHIPITTAEKLPAIGKNVKLYIQAVYREDSQNLYGFSTREERDFFRLLIEKVSGVGPKVALSILSKLSLHLLKRALISGDIESLTSCPGIGKKTAERLIIELKDKLGGTSEITKHIVGEEVSSNNISDAVSALVTLGYKPTEADKAVRKIIEKDKEISTEEIVKKVFSKRT